jgi:hypothetical protein
MSLPDFDSLPEGDATLRQVTMLGAISGPANGAAEMQCDVIFAIRTTMQNGGFGDFTGETQTFRLGVGSLPAFKIGHIYRGRDFVADKPRGWRKAEHETVLSGYMTKAFPLGAAVTAPPEGFRPGIPLYPIGDSGALAYVYRLETKSGDSEPYHSTFLPVHELIRYLWGRTSDSYKRTFDGQIGTHPQQPLFHQSSSGFESDNSSVLRIETNRDLTKAEVWSVRRLFLDATARKRYRSIFATWQSRQGRGPVSVHPHPMFMLPEGTIWDFEYVWIAVQHSSDPSRVLRRRLITRINKIHESDPHILVRLVKPTTTRSDAEPAAQQPGTRRSIQTRTSPSLGIPREPSARFVESTFIDRGDDLPEIPMEREVREIERNTHPVRTLVQLEQQAFVGSTADRGNRNSDVVPVSFRDDSDLEPPMPVPDRLTPFLATIDHLNELGLQAKIVPASSGEQFWRFPFMVSGKEARWSYIDPRAKRRRHVVVAKVEFDGRLYYLFEIENSGETGDVYSVGILPLPGPTEFDDADFSALLSRLAKSRCSWLSADPAFMTQRHENSWTPQQLARHIALRIRKHAERIGPAPTADGL